MDDFDRNKRLVDERKKANEMRRKQYVKDRLEYNISKKIRTTMIGALDSMEKNFGHLWGHGLPENELTEEQLFWDEIWEETRAQILNKGNQQIRAAQDELSEYDMQWNQPTIQFVTKRGRTDE